MTPNQYYGLPGWLFFSAVKFFYAPASIYSVGGYSYGETLLISIAGGWLGVFAFYYLGEIIFTFWRWVSDHFIKRKAKTIFTKTNKRIIKIKNHRLGLIMLALLSPCLLSIPLGSFIAAKYFSNNRLAIPILMLAVVFWALILTTLVGYFDIRF